MLGLIGDVPHTKRFQHHTLHTSAGQIAVAQAAAQHSATRQRQEVSDLGHTATGWEKRGKGGGRDSSATG